MTVKRLAIDSNGWVIGVRHHNTPNQNNGMMVPAGVLGVVEHSIMGTLTSADSWLTNPAAEASAHFGIGKDGKIVQWVNIKGGVAWHAKGANYSRYGFENEGGFEALTDAQLNANAQLVELAARVGNFALQVSNSPDTEGVGTHRMGGALWGGHTDPGPTRTGQRAEIVRRAKIIQKHGQYPAPGQKEPTVTGLKRIKVGDTSFQIGWKAAGDVPAYYLEVWSGGKIQGKPWIRPATKGTTQWVVELEPKTQYTVFIRPEPKDGNPAAKIVITTS